MVSIQHRQIRWTAIISSGDRLKRADIKTTRRPGPYCFLTLQCHCLCLKSYGPTRRPQRSPFPRPNRLRRRSRWWWSPTRSSSCVCNGRSCPLWCRGRPSRRWSPKSSQSAGCPSREWMAAVLEWRKQDLTKEEIQQHRCGAEEQMCSWMREFKHSVSFRTVQAAVYFLCSASC